VCVISWKRHTISSESRFPQANAAERVNRSVLQILRATIATDQRNWDTQLSRIDLGMDLGTRVDRHGTILRNVRNADGYPRNSLSDFTETGGIQAGDPQISLPEKMELIRQKVT